MSNRILRAARVFVDPKDISLLRERNIMKAWAEGMTCYKIAQFHDMTLSSARDVISKNLKGLWKAKYQWKMAEMRCRAMALELRYYRLGQVPPEDKPIESLGPSIRAVEQWKKIGITTVNQLRSVDPDILMNWRIPRRAIVWAILKLDAAGLSHRLSVYRPQRTVIPHAAEFRAAVGGKWARSQAHYRGGGEPITPPSTSTSKPASRLP